jgi:hypothetical protein
MACRLRISSRDGRALLAGPYAIVDRDSNALVSVHRSHADAMRAMVTLTQVSNDSAASGCSSGQLQEVIESVCARMHSGVRVFDKLYGNQQVKLIAAVLTELRSRR